LTAVEKRRYGKFGLFLVVVVGMFVLDQLTKSWVRQHVPPHGSWQGGWPIPGVFELTLTYNQGIAFGLFKGLATLMTPIAVVIAGGSTWYSFQHPKEITLSHIAMGLLASGALGNLYDRLRDTNGVTDMFWFRTIDFPVFNVADSCITVSTILLIITWWIDASRGASANRPGLETAPPGTRKLETSAPDTE
jgi:signal peptidase II